MAWAFLYFEINQELQILYHTSDYHFISLKILVYFSRIDLSVEIEKRSSMYIIIGKNWVEMVSIQHFFHNSTKKLVTKKKLEWKWIIPSKNLKEKIRIHYLRNATCNEQQNCQLYENNKLSVCANDTLAFTIYYRDGGEKQKSYNSKDLLSELKISFMEIFPRWDQIIFYTWGLSISHILVQYDVNLEILLFVFRYGFCQ